jgi:hypothetical protein
MQQLITFLTTVRDGSPPWLWSFWDWLIAQLRQEMLRAQEIADAAFRRLWDQDRLLLGTSRDQWHGHDDPDFQKWVHKQKDPGDRDFTDKELDDLQREYDRLHKPGPDHKGKYGPRGKGKGRQADDPGGPSAFDLTAPEATTWDVIVAGAKAAVVAVASAGEDAASAAAAVETAFIGLMAGVQERARQEMEETEQRNLNPGGYRPPGV